MKNAGNTDIVLRRCKFMNCVQEGQSFSLGVMDSELGGRQIVDATMQMMSTDGLLSKGKNGTFVLTELGARAVTELVAATKPSRVRNGNWHARRNEEKPAT